MYSLNLAGRFTLISNDECNAKLGINVDNDKWLSAIEVAELRFVQAFMGYDFYQDFIAQKNVTLTSGNIAGYQTIFDAQYPPAGRVVLQVGQIINAIELVTTPTYVTLWNNFLWRYVYECVFLIALPNNYAQFSSSGVLKNNPMGSIVGDSKPTNSVGIDLKDCKFLQDRQLLDKINPLETIIRQYLCLNLGDYPLYDSKKCEWLNTTELKDNPKQNRVTSFLDILYKDDDDNWQNRCDRRGVV